MNRRKRRNTEWSSLCVLGVEHVEFTCLNQRNERTVKVLTKCMFDNPLQKVDNGWVQDDRDTPGCF